MGNGQLTAQIHLTCQGGGYQRPCLFCFFAVWTENATIFRVFSAFRWILGFVILCQAFGFKPDCFTSRSRWVESYFGLGSLGVWLGPAHGCMATFATTCSHSITSCSCGHMDFGTQVFDVSSNGEWQDTIEEKVVFSRCSFSTNTRMTWRSVGAQHVTSVGTCRLHLMDRLNLYIYPPWNFHSKMRVVNHPQDHIF